MLGALLLAPTAHALAPAAASPSADPYQAWADSVIGKGVAAGGASAATVAIVKDGKIVAVRGYGRPGPDASRPVDPARDRFQIASVSKTFAGLLLADLVLSGQMPPLDTPANAVLKRVTVPTLGGRPIRLRHLVSHAAGFEERGFGYFDSGRMAAIPTGDDIRAIMPAQVRPAGAAIVYANISAPLVALAIEDATGRRYGDLVAERLLRPIGMAATRFNLSGVADAALVRPFRPGGSLIPRQFNAPFFAPTGSIETTAPDMARYMLAMLGDGSGGLRQGVPALATRPLAGNGPGLDGIGAFWMLGHWGKSRTWEHAGGLAGVAATLVLVPDQKLGLFVAWAAPAPPLGYGDIRDSFLQRFVGPVALAPAMAGADRGIEGRYWAERRPHSTAEMLFFLGATTDVVRTDAGILINGQPVTRIGPGLYERQPSPGRAPARWLFRAGELRERVGVARKVTGLADPHLQLILALTGAGLAFSGLFAAIWARGPARWMAPAGALVAAAVPATVLVLGGPEAIADAMQNGQTLAFSIGGGLTVLLAGQGLALLALTGRSRAGRLPARLHLALAGVGALLLATMLTFWRLPFPLHG
ncbi:MAG: beta-lactamase family protein [Alphaproteobacteria bacterium]|nr:beta-lactamase family protein [Alphaproteobacteria bacterium]